jgi:hypothetical protein
MRGQEFVLNTAYHLRVARRMYAQTRLTPTLRHTPLIAFSFRKTVCLTSGPARVGVGWGNLLCPRHKHMYDLNGALMV